MPDRAGKYEVKETLKRSGPVEVLRVRGPQGEGKLYWFEVHDPRSRERFLRYRGALKRLADLGALPQGVEISARPGRYYVYWPETDLPPPPKGRRTREALRAVEAILAESGYPLEAAALAGEGGKVVVTDLEPLAEPVPRGKAGGRKAPPRPASRLPGVVLGVLGLFLLALGVERYLNPPVVVLPDLVGKSVTEAERALRSSGLILTFVPQSLPDTPPGVIVDQSPPAGTRLKPGRRVRLFYSHPEERRVPVLTGRSLAEAEAELAELGYRVGEPAWIHDPSPPDTVLATSPPANTPLPSGAEVKLLVSLGPRPERTLVPDLRDTTPKEEEALLRLAGLEVGRRERVPAPYPEDTLIGQSPRAKTVIEVGAPVATARSEAPEVLLPEQNPAQRAPGPAPTPSPSPVQTGVVLEEGERRVPLVLRLPPDLEGRSVRLVVTDENGTRVLYEGPTQKGWRLEGEVAVKGKATFRLYVGDYLYQEWDVGP